MNDFENTQDYVCSISPTEFEEFCMELLKSYAIEEGLKEFSIDHNVKMKAADGTYQIDIYSSFTAVGVQFRVLCECKQYTSPVKRERVELLESRLKSLGMHKGILLSTSGFQSGAIQFAKAHGIALIQVYDQSCHKVSHSAGTEVAIDDKDPIKYIEDHWPPHRAICFTERTEEPIVLFPTTEIVNEIYAEANKLLMEQYGFEVPLSKDTCSEYRGQTPLRSSSKNSIVASDEIKKDEDETQVITEVTTVKQNGSETPQQSEQDSSTKQSQQSGQESNTDNTQSSQQNVSGERSQSPSGDSTSIGQVHVNDDGVIELPFVPVY